MSGIRFFTEANKGNKGEFFVPFVSFCNIF